MSILNGLIWTEIAPDSLRLAVYVGPYFGKLMFPEHILCRRNYFQNCYRRVPGMMGSMRQCHALSAVEQPLLSGLMDQDDVRCSIEFGKGLACVHCRGDMKLYAEQSPRLRRRIWLLTLAFSPSFEQESIPRLLTLVDGYEHDQ